MNVSKDVISGFNIVLYSVQQVCTPHMGLTKKYHITSACGIDTEESIWIHSKKFQREVEDELGKCWVKRKEGERR